ncbi:MAG TPA: BamA/TamA family outer membrane protein [Candidatus Krumholzibacteria bacterium]|nr:BamA/TamA family outer membrane protein [Candidatus Krumholzibacteria bacterium]
MFVHGNTRVKSIAILREMESQPGQSLNALAVDRDQRYLGDLSPFATVDIHVEPIGEDHCILHVVVTERPSLLLKLIYPVLEYDLNSERITYGLKWSDRNFRRRLENFSADGLRDNRNNNSASIGWSSGWVGWKHMGVGMRASYFDRSGPTSKPTIFRQERVGGNLNIPLTERRIAFSQVLTGLSYAQNHIGVRSDSTGLEELISPAIGFRFDSRDTSLKPRRGGLFYVNLLSNFILHGQGNAYYLIDNDMRYFHSLDRTTVLALRSTMTVQLADYPDYIRLGIGGPGTIRGYERSDFRSAHRWVQSAELRLLPWPKVLYKLPFVGLTDFQLGLVLFVDTGIGWTKKSEFAYDNFHSGFGMGLRLFSPIQDALRLDVGYSGNGRIRPYFSTGMNF